MFKTNFMSLKSRFTQLTTAAIFFAALFIISCNKEKSNDGLTPQEEEFASQATSEADAESEIIFNDVFDNVMGVSDEVGMAGVGVFGRVNNSGGAGETARTSACHTVTVTHLNPPNVFPVKIVIEFDGTCVGRDGHRRSGKIITVYSNRLIVPGATAVTEFEDFKFDEIKVEGRHQITNLSTVTTPTNSLTHKWKVEVTGAKLTKPNGNYTEWNSTKTITQIEGMATIFNPFDDIYKIEGSANGKVKRGDLLLAWRTDITEPLIKKFTCRWIVKGILKVIRLNLTSNSQWVASLDYGNGACDNKAVATINGVVHEITLP
jgi:hypothetical protein